MNVTLIPLLKTVALCALSAVFVGCTSQAPQPDIVSNLPANDDYQSVAFDDCSYALSATASSADNPAKYHLTAKQALSCMDEAPRKVKGQSNTSVMQMHGLAIVNLFKSGQLAMAQQQLNRFKRHYPHQDLMLEGGTSLIDTLSLILGEAPIELAAKGSLLNASPVLKSELRRQQYWQVN